MEVLDQNIAILESNKSKLETLKSLFSPVTEDAVEEQSDK